MVPIDKLWNQNKKKKKKKKKTFAPQFKHKSLGVDVQNKAFMPMSIHLKQ